MNKTIITILCIIIVVMLLFEDTPDYKFTVIDPPAEIEIEILDGGATTNRYYQVKIKILENDKENIFKFESLKDIYALQTNKTNDTFMVILGWFNISRNTFEGDTVRFCLRE